MIKLVDAVLIKNATLSQVSFLTELKWITITGWISAMIVLSSVKRNIELRIERTTKAYFKPLISQGGSSSIASRFSVSISFIAVIELFSDISTVSFYWFKSLKAITFPFSNKEILSLRVTTIFLFLKLISPNLASNFLRVIKRGIFLSGIEILGIFEI